MKLGVGTFIVREDAAADLDKTLSRLAEIGYDGVELLGFFGKTAAEINQILNKLQIQALGDHVQVEDIMDDSKQVVQEHSEIGCPFVTLNFGKDIVDKTPFEQLAVQCKAAAERCLQMGIKPLYHNHDFDMHGEIPFAERMLDAVPELCFEPDLGWMVASGKDPAYYLDKYTNRIPVVHLKDVFLTEDGFTFRPTGYGVVNTPALLPKILKCNPDWLMVDHDLAYDRSSYDDLRLSYEYVKALLKVAE